MKKILTILLLSAFFSSCIKKNETTSTEGENLKKDIKDVKNDIKEFSKQPKDSMASEIKEEIKSEDGFEGSKNREF